MLVCLGVLLIGLILWEVFNDLWHPSGSGALSGWIGRSVHAVFRRAPRLLPIAGPLSVILVIGAWVAALVLGFALIYVGAFPEDFRTSTGEVPLAAGGFLASLYFSFETLITLGYGDLVPASQLTRFAATFEALVGFGLLTASVSSIVLLYPALSRMRLLARSVSHAVRAEQLAGISFAESGSEAVPAALASAVTQLRIDLVHFPVLYYFVAREEDASVARWMSELERLAVEGSGQQCAATARLAALALQSALDELAAILAQRFLRMEGADRAAIFRAFAEAHGTRARTWAPPSGARA